MSRYGVRICEFDSTADIPRRKLTYKVLKARVLKEGVFSVFEATEDQRLARLFERLSKDPELEVKPMRFPWYSVRRKG